MERTRVAAVFDAVADLDATRRERALDEACADDPTLRREVEQLLAHDRLLEQDDFLAPPPALVLKALAARAHDKEPARIGRFRVLERIGEGAMGVVYAGHDEALDRRVALKLLHDDAAARTWLMREGALLGRVTHPNVVTVYEVGEHEGHVYLAMQLVEGPSLKAWLAEERRSFAEVLRLFREIARGLAAVHDAGLVHRDFKPDNVLIGPTGHPQIADFGIAALTAPQAAAPDGTAHRTRTIDTTIAARGLVGTPAYMAPEVLLGARATAASDQWSFCAALYRAAYGTPPFPAKDADLQALTQIVAHGAPLPPPRRADVPPWLGPILLKGLSRDPAARFASMEALLAAIEKRLPRNPELDPAPVRIEVRILRLAVLCAALFAAWLFLSGRIALTPKALVALSAGMLLLEFVVIGIRWPSLSRNYYGRRTAGTLVAATIAILLHRLIALRLGTPVAHVMTIDLLLLALVYGFAAVAAHRWIASLSVIAAACAAGSALVPSLVDPLFLIGTIGTVMAATADAFRRR